MILRSRGVQIHRAFVYAVNHDISDALVGAGLGDRSLRYALPTLIVPAIAASLLFFRSAAHLPRELTPMHTVASEEESPSGEVALVS